MNDNLRQFKEGLRDRKDKVKSGNTELMLNEIILKKP